MGMAKSQERIVYLTTEDNPYNPYTHFDEWYAFDTQHGYNSCAYLARLARTSYGLSDRENNLEIEEAIDKIVQLNLTGNYKKLVIIDGKSQEQISEN